MGRSLWHVIGLRWDAQALKSRIETRVHQMIEAGWLSEVSEIVNQGFGSEVRGFSAIGYRFILRVLEGSMSLDDARDEIVRQTHKYAKRQMTWFRREPDVKWVDCPFVWTELLEDVRGFLGVD